MEDYYDFKETPSNLTDEEIIDAVRSSLDCGGCFYAFKFNQSYKNLWHMYKLGTFSKESAMEYILYYLQENDVDIRIATFRSFIREEIFNFLDNMVKTYKVERDTTHGNGVV